ncbi:MAG: hypothetical protein KDB84_12225, partial [Flavobacteriales bacterium]|nr:hypothetical protein [Flavobacteriales bacterium]
APKSIHTMGSILTTLFAVAFIALILTSTLYYGFRRAGPWRSFWSLLIVLFLGLAFATAWMRPMGPLWYDVAWVDMFIFGLFLALLLAAASPVRPRRRTQDPTLSSTVIRDGEGSVVALSIFFWLLIAFAVVGALIMLAWSAPDAEVAFHQGLVMDTMACPIYRV